MAQVQRVVEAGSTSSAIVESLALFNWRISRRHHFNEPRRPPAGHRPHSRPSVSDEPTLSPILPDGGKPPSVAVLIQIRVSHGE